MQTSAKLDKLRSMLERQPSDPFLLYGIALEHKKLGALDIAIQYLERCTAADLNYCYAYFQIGQVRESQGHGDLARHAYNAGIVAAQRCGDAHAESELRGALDMLG